MIVFHPFNPVTRPGDQVATWKWLRELPPTVRVVHWPCFGQLDYSEGLRRVWDQPGHLLIVEQDNVLTDAQFLAMVACEADACTRPYWLGPGSTGLPDPILSIWGHEGRRPDFQVERTAFSAVGAVRLSSGFRCRVGPPAVSQWNSVEHAVNKLVAGDGQSWHVHWPICDHQHSLGANHAR